MGKCPTCGEWNTLQESLQAEKSPGGRDVATTESTGIREKAKPIHEISREGEERTDTKDAELNRVLGGGLVKGSVILLGGEPGIGKSTLLLQLMLTIGKKSLYLSGEESAEQISMRADRIGGKDDQNCHLLTDTSLENLIQQIEEHAPQLLVVDSIQTLYTTSIDSAPGSLPQIRECAAALIRYAKRSGIPIFLIGHITKEGGLAGPKILEHMVDTVLQFEGDRDHLHRLLRTTKNRFGSTNELGIYEMTGKGLSEVADPSRILISHNDESLSGVAISATVEGIRPLMVEIQALVSNAAYGTPQREATGVQLRRASMLLAVLEKRCGFKMGTKDVFLNITGGIRIDDPGVDLGLISAILSSQQDLPIPQNTCFAGEVGLAGEIRPVNRAEQRISEASRLGYERMIISAKERFDPSSTAKKLNIIKTGRVEEVFEELFG